jgi:hypothetical protein
MRAAEGEKMGGEKGQKSYWVKRGVRDRLSDIPVGYEG